MCASDDASPTATVLTGEAVEPIAWAVGRDRLAGAMFYWLATADLDGHPHVRPVLAVWLDGAMHTTSSPRARKAANLSGDPRCTLSVTTDGMDVAFEGRARRVTDHDELERLSAAYHEKYGWPTTVVGEAFDAPYGAPSAGPPPYQPYRIEPARVFGFGTDDDLAPRTTRWDFDADGP
jgi:hypothetical protein